MNTPDMPVPFPVPVHLHNFIVIWLDYLGKGVYHRQRRDATQKPKAKAITQSREIFGTSFEGCGLMSE